MGNVAMQLIAETLNSEVLTNENVLFDTIKYTSGDINYDINTGTITLTQPGRYIIH